MKNSTFWIWAFVEDSYCDLHYIQFDLFATKNGKPFLWKVCLSSVCRSLVAPKQYSPYCDDYGCKRFDFFSFVAICTTSERRVKATATYTISRCCYMRLINWTRAAAEMATIILQVCSSENSNRFFSKTSLFVHWIKFPCGQCNGLTGLIHYESKITMKISKFPFNSAWISSAKVWFRSHICTNTIYFGKNSCCTNHVTLTFRHVCHTHAALMKCTLFTRITAELSLCLLAAQNHTFSSCFRLWDLFIE